jgi:hypothetical protein
MNDASTVWQGELELLPPDPWQGREPEVPPAGAMQPYVIDQLREPVQPHEVDGPRGGRRPGSSNKRADDLTDYVARRYGDPLEHLARRSAQSVTDLARDCGVPRLVAFDFRCAVERLLARFVEAAPAKPVLLSGSGGSQMGALHLAAAQSMAKAFQADPETPAPLERVQADNSVLLLSDSDSPLE